jgi:hypothetical protein
VITYIECLEFGILLYVLSMEIAQNCKSFAAVNGKYCKILSIAVLVFVFTDIQEAVTCNITKFCLTDYCYNVNAGNHIPLWA